MMLEGGLRGWRAREKGKARQRSRQESGKVTVKDVGGSDKPMGRQENSNGRRRGMVNSDCTTLVQSPRCCLQVRRLFGARRDQRSAAAFRVPHVESKTMR